MAAFDSLAGHQRDRDREDDVDVVRPEPELPPGKRTLIEAESATQPGDRRTADIAQLRRTLHAMSGGGSALPDGVSAEYSRLLGADLSGVRVHASGPASDAAARLGASAFTHGSQIAFAPGQYDPGSVRTQHILAHELVHVVQNMRAGRAMEVAARLEVGASGSEVESEAEAGAHALLAGSAFAVGVRASLPAISMFGGNDPVPASTDPSTNKSVDPNAGQPNASVDPNAAQPNATVDPNAGQPNKTADANKDVDPNATPNKTSDPNAGGSNATPGPKQTTPDPTPGAGPDAGAGGAAPDAKATPTEAPKSIDSRIAEILEQRADKTAQASYHKGLGQVQTLRLQSLQYAFTPSGFGHTLFQTLVFPTDAISDHWGQVYKANAYRGGTSWADTLQASIEGLRGLLHIVGDLCSIISAWAGMVAVVAALIALIGSETGVLAVVGGAVAAIADTVAIVFALAKMLLDLIDVLLGVLQMLILVIRARASKDPGERARFAQLLKKEAGDFAGNVVGIAAQLTVMVVTAGVGTGMTKGITKMGLGEIGKTFGAELGKLLLPKTVLAPFLKFQFRTAFRGLTGHLAAGVTGSAVGKGVKVAGGIKIPGAAQGAEGVLGMQVLRRVAGRVTKDRQLVEFTTKNQMNGARVVRVNQFLRKTAGADFGGVTAIAGTGQIIVQTKQPDPTSIAKPGGGGSIKVPDKPSGALTTVMMWPSQLEAMTAAKAPIGDAIERMKEQHKNAADQAGPELAAQVDAKLKEVSERRAKQAATAKGVDGDAAAGKQNSDKGADTADKGKDTKAKADGANKKIGDEQKKVGNEGAKLQAPPPKDGILGKLYNATVGKIGSWVGSAQTWLKNFIGKGLMMAAGFDKADLDLAGIENDMRTDSKKDTESQQAAQDVQGKDDELQQAVYKLMEEKDSDQQAAIQGMAETQAFIEALEEADKVLEEAIKNGGLYIDEAATIIQHELDVQSEGKAIDDAYVAPIIGYADAFTASISEDTQGAVAQQAANEQLDQLHTSFEGLDVGPGKSKVAGLVSQYKTIRATQVTQAKADAERIKTTINGFVTTTDYAGVNANAQALDKLIADFDEQDDKLLDALYHELNAVLSAENALVDQAIQACPDDGAAATTTPGVPPPDPDQNAKPPLGPVNRKADGGQLAPDARDRLRAADGSPSTPLPDDLRTRFEASLGADLRDVRLHTGADSAAAARAVGARAYAVGRDVHFGEGEFDPSSRRGQELIAHEVAHTVQQPAAASSASLEVTEPGDAVEHAADAAASAMMEGQAAAVAPAAPTIARDTERKPIDFLSSLYVSAEPFKETHSGALSTDKIPERNKVKIKAPEITATSKVKLHLPDDKKLGEYSVKVGPIQTLVSSTRTGVYKGKDGKEEEKTHSMAMARDAAEKVYADDADLTPIPVAEKPFYAGNATGAVQASELTVWQGQEVTDQSADVIMKDQPSFALPLTLPDGQQLVAIRGKDSFNTSAGFKGKQNEVVALAPFNWSLAWDTPIAADGTATPDPKRDAIKNEGKADEAIVIDSDDYANVMVRQEFETLEQALQQEAWALLRILPKVRARNSKSGGFIEEALRQKNPGLSVMVFVDHTRSTSKAGSSVTMRVSAAIAKRAERTIEAKLDAGGVPASFRLLELADPKDITDASVLFINIHEDDMLGGNADFPFPFASDATGKIGQNEGADGEYRVNVAQAGGGGPVRRKADGSGVALDAGQKLAAAESSSGNPLPDELRAKFERSTGADLSDVRLHTGAASQEAAGAVGARAYAVGRDVHFGAGHYDPSSAEGERLIAHEVAHTVQQGSVAPSRQAELEVSSPADAAEHEADRAADAMISGAQADIAGAGGSAAVIARDGDEDEGVDAKTYVQYGSFISTMILADLITKRAALELTIDSKYARWTGAGAKGFLAKAFPFSGDFRLQLALWIPGGVPAVDDLINKGRHLNMTGGTEKTPPKLGTKGPNVYSPDVAVELFNALRPRILESFNRMLPRYVDARTAAANKLGKCDGKPAPEPAAVDIIVSASIDQHVADGLCSGVVELDWENYLADHPDAAKAKIKRPLDVTLDTVSEHSFWVTAKPKEGGEPATPEEVSTALYGSSTYALDLVGAPPRFGSNKGTILKAEWKDAIRKKANAEIWDGACDVFLDGASWFAIPFPDQDPVAALLKDGKKADQIALEQAGKYKATAASKDDIVKRIGESLGLVQAIDAGAAKLGITGQLDAIKAQLKQREGDFQKDAGEAMKWDAHSAKQREVLKSASDGMTGVVGFWDGMVDKLKDPSGKNVDKDITDLLKGAAHDYVSVAAHSHLIEFAAQAAAKAAEKNTTLPFDIMEAMLRAASRMVEEAAKHKGAEETYSLDDMRKREHALREKISANRAAVLKDPSLLQHFVDELMAEVGDFQTEASLVANLDQLNDLIDQFDDEDGFVANLPTDDGEGYGGPHVENLGEIIREDIAGIKVWRDKWKPVYAAWKATDKIKDAQEKKRARDKVKADIKALLADGKYIEALQFFSKELVEVKKAIAIMKIALAIIAIIAITLVSMGAGLAMGSFATGLMAGAVEAGTITAATAGTIAGGVSLVTEAAVFTALNTVFFAENPTWQSVTFEFASNLVMFGALKALNKAYRAAEAVKTALEGAKLGAKALAVGGEMTINFVTMNAALLAKEKIAYEMGIRKRDLTWEETKGILAQSTGMMIAMAIAGRAAAPLFENIQKASGTLGGRIAGMNAARAELFGAALAAHENPSAEKIAALINQDKAELKNELEVFDLISKDPKALELAGLQPHEIAAITHDTALAVYQAKVGEALAANATLITAGQYRCTPAQKQAIVDAYGKEAKVESVAKDETAKTETFTITPKEGPSIRLTVGDELPAGSKVDAPAEAKDAPPALGHDSAKEPPSLDGVPAGKADIARWQTKGITTDAPDLWAKKAKDGTLFKDAYKKWIEQEHPYVQKNGVLEPVKPDGVSAEAWGEFKPTFESIVKKGNITLTTRGAEQVDKLKAAGIDLAHLDPTTPEYAKVRPKILETIGKEALERWESSMLHGEGDPARAALDARIKKVLADDALAQLRAAFPDCEILLTGSASQAGKPITAVKDIDVIIVAPEGSPAEWRIAAEKRAGEMKLPAGKDLIEAGGPKTLDVDAKVMTKEQYLGLRSLDPKGRTEMTDVRIDNHVKTPDDIAKAAGLTDPAAIAAFKTLYAKHPGFATELVNSSATNLPRIARMPAPQLAKLEALGEAGFRRIVSMPQPMFERFIALPEAKLKLFADLPGDKLARFEALTDRQFARVAALDPAKIHAIDAMSDADFATATGSATTADAAYLQKVADFKGVHLDEVTNFYEEMMTLGIDHNQLIEAAMARYPTLTRAEADAIFGYTTKLFYRDLNNVLNAGGNPDAARLSTLLQKGLASMPAAGPVQYRGLRLGSAAEIAAFDAEYAVGSVVETKAYWSTGPDPGNAYAGGRNLVIHTTAAKDISQLAFGVHFHGVVGKPTYSSEAIIPPGVKFEVIAVDTATGTVTLQQL